MTRPLALLLLAAVLAAPLARAQASTSLVLAAVPPEAPLAAGDRLTFGGMATFTADALVYGNTQGVPVTYTVTNAPEWATVVVSPQTDVFPVMVGAAPSYTASRAFTILVDGAPTGPDGALGLIEIAATATPTMMAGKPATAKVAVPIRFDAGDEPCPGHPEVQTALAILRPDAPAPAEAQEPPAQDDGTTTVQSSRATPVALPAAAVLGFGAAGAGVGLLLRRRRG
ncbi:MAG TPA: hypothetical protein VNX21_07030 [Candidatus Thermoplasmatota archaeon]|nr:hypothetical protein [Candidatus Thermoplasmatota archaeon]